MSDYLISYAQAVRHHACSDSLDLMREALGGDWGVYGRATPIPLPRVLEALGVEDCVWALAVVNERAAHLVASDFAAHVHDVWDGRFPDDERPADAIRAVRAWVAGRIPDQEMREAAEDARVAAWDAAKKSDATRAGWAAWSAWFAAAVEATDAASAAEAAEAARVAEAAWQRKHLRAVITGRREPGRVRIRGAGHHEEDHE